MNKMIMNRLTMLAVTLMASMACFAQGKLATSIPGGLGKDAEFDYMELKYKIIDAESSYEVKVIGFAEAFKADPSKFDTAEEGVEIHHHNEVFIPHYIGQDDKVAVNVYVSSVAEGALNTTDTELASKVTALVIDYQDNIKTQGIPMAIGANAFAGLTGLKTINSHIPGEALQEIDEDTFAENVYNKTTLIVPEGSLKEYNGTDFWSYFYKVTDGDHIKGDVDGDNVVDTWDFQLILEAFIYSDPYDPLMDLDGDGSIDLFDAQLVLDIFNVY